MKRLQKLQNAHEEVTATVRRATVSLEGHPLSAGGQLASKVQAVSVQAMKVYWTAEV